MTGYKNAPHMTPQPKQKLITKSKTCALYVDEACQKCGGQQYAPADESVSSAFRMEADGTMDAGPFKCFACGSPIGVSRVITVDGVEASK
jgi:hypothetical protein